ncbi:MAG: Calx-beta domain-containing protein, partial [Planctomycetaceae bacterium]
MMPTWLNCLNRSFRSTRHRHSRKHAAGRPELLEQRTYLSVSSLVSNSQLIIVSDGDDSIEVRSDPGGSGQVQVVVNGLLDNTLPVLQASEVSRIEIDAGPGDNLIDLNAITAADFSFVDGANGNGLQIMVDAGDGQDTVFGSQSFGDVLVGGDGQDVINVQAVNQILGDQIIEGGDGNDTLSGGSGSDTIRGGDGDDLIVGDEFSAVAPIPGVGADVLSGGDGNDTIQGEAGDDSIHGNMGEDSLLGGPGNDTINGDSGQDVIQGQAGADFLLGGGGADALNGNDGADTLLGNGGDDTLLGGTGPDSLQGGNGNDALDTGDQFLSVDDVIVNPEGDFGFSSAVFTLSLSDLSALDVSFDVATVDGLAVDGLDYLGVFRRVTIPAGQLQVAVSVPVLGDTVAETTENFFLTLSNAENAVIGGAGQASIIDDGDGPVQVVFLDFDTATEVDEVQFTQTMRDAIQQNMAADFGAFNVVFTQMQPTGDFTTVLFNEEPFFGPGGLASDGIDFRNLSFNDTVILKPDGFFGFPGAPPFTEATIISSNSNIAAHELGHAMGLRHRDSFGPIGSGVPDRKSV